METQQFNFKTLKTTFLSQHLLLLTLNRPTVCNAINSIMMQELKIFWQASANFKEVRCIIITGEGSAFCAGADLKERKGLDLLSWRKQRLTLSHAMIALFDCDIPIIVAVNGAAFGGGLELMLACDFAYASETATFAQSEVKLGLMPGAMGTQTLPRACGLRRAKELTFTGKIFTAQQALRWGIINQICTSDKLLPTIINIGEKISENAPLAVSQAKKSLMMSQSIDMKSGFAFEREAYQGLLSTADREEGIAAFNEKRKPLFTGK